MIESYLLCTYLLFGVEGWNSEKNGLNENTYQTKRRTLWTRKSCQREQKKGYPSALWHGNYNGKSFHLLVSSVISAKEKLITKKNRKRKMCSEQARFHDLLIKSRMKFSILHEFKYQIQSSRHSEIAIINYQFVTVFHLSWRTLCLVGMAINCSEYQYKNA